MKALVYAILIALFTLLPVKYPEWYLNRKLKVPKMDFDDLNY